MRESTIEPSTNYTMTLDQTFDVARRLLAQRGIEDSSLEAEVLLRHTLGLTRAQFYAGIHRVVSPEQSKEYRQLVERRLTGEPTAYITGHREFFGLDFHVDSRVLIPRPESELLVEKAIESARRGAMSFADIGTGSGALAVSIAVNMPRVMVYATDVSRDALEVARLNCWKHGVEGSIKLLRGDLLEPLPEPVDVIVANLPYVRATDLTAVTTRGFEPRLALDGGSDGLDTIRRMVKQVEGKLNPGGTMLLEIGYGHEDEAVRFLNERFPAAKIEVTPDLVGIPRVVAVAFQSGV